MANHGFVKTKKWIRPEAIDQMLADLNQTHFLGNLVSEYSYSEDPGASGPHSWIIRYVSGGREWGERVFWLNSNRSFEIRHGGGSDFIWWVDAVIRNEVALRFDGMISDEGASGKEKGEWEGYQTFSQFLDKMYDGVPPDVLAPIKQLQLEMTPPEHGGVEASDSVRGLSVV